MSRFFIPFIGIAMLLSTHVVHATENVDKPWPQDIIPHACRMEVMQELAKGNSIAHASLMSFGTRHYVGQPGGILLPVHQGVSLPAHAEGEVILVHSPESSWDRDKQAFRSPRAELRSFFASWKGECTRLGSLSLSGREHLVTFQTPTASYTGAVSFLVLN